MAMPMDESTSPLTQEIFIRADEVDSGTTITSPGSQKPLSALAPVDGTSSATTRPKPPPRPALRREGSAAPPPPPSIPPPAPPVNATDSLSLPQLRQLVSQFPKTEERAYAYQYRDAEDYATEIDEWFHYTELEQDREYVLAAREAFEQRWKAFCRSEMSQDDVVWHEIDAKYRRDFVRKIKPDLDSESTGIRHEAIATVYYILLGVWSITAGVGPGQDQDMEDDQNEPERHSTLQMTWMHRGADLIATYGIPSHVYTCLRTVLEQSFEASKPTPEDRIEDAPNETQSREITLCLSCLYLVAESARTRHASVEGRKVRRSLTSSSPDMLIYFVGVISRLRWDESCRIPSTHIVILLWKLFLVFFGDTKTHLEKIKSILQPRIDPFSSEAAKPILTASPLDYHLFRQEVTSKYPAYNPPPPLIPLEMEQKTMLPPPYQTSRMENYDAFTGHGGMTSGGGGSIFHQPVHIATPAPSPPPSPAIGGKVGKKQNYQTNQMLPFMYPPLDSASNKIGGKGTTEFQDMMVGKKWEGSDIPASIIEAGELFASRMRMTRAMRQLWKERDSFVKYERGWHGAANEVSSKTKSGKENDDDDGDDEDNLEDENLQGRMDAVEVFFHQALPDLQSLIIVMMKMMLQNVQDIAIRNGVGQEGQMNGLNRTKSNPNLTQNQSFPIPPPPPRPNEMTLDELDDVRSREISQKAISGTIFLLLKWFKISHILKIEYLTQLLLDSNYIQLTLKYFAHQHLEDLVSFKYDRNDLSFWHYCHLHSDHPPLSPTSPESQPQSETSSVDEAIPPPIQRHRRSPTTHSEGLTTLTHVQSPETTITQRPPSRPTVDELGNPLAPLPSTPITTFSPRQFQTSIHLLRVLQKITRSKSHRILLLVQFKSSQILRRVLRVPDPVLRLYVLKLFKSQVPYCGRKWRQSNMRVITAIYLHCRPELRDEWLAGMHDTNVEGEVEEAMPLEWALRGLTYWWMKRTYKDVMGLKKAKNQSKGQTPRLGDDVNVDLDLEIDIEQGAQEVDDDERDFFQRELDALGWGMAALNTGEDVAFGEEAPGLVSAIPTTATNGETQHGNWETQGSSAASSAAQNSGAGGLEMW